MQSQHRFLLRQKLTLLVNRYEYFSYADAVQGEMIAFAEQKRFAFREAFTVWKNDARNEVLFTVTAEKLLDIHGRFLVHDEHGVPIGYCRKVFGSSLVRSTWEVRGADETLHYTAKEKNVAIAVIRRIAQFIPYLTDIAPFFPFNFVFEKDGAVVGEHHRVWGTLTDQYAIELHEQLKQSDRRLVLALGILLDALQDR